ncbi:MAG: hypothetical protein GF315_10020 [candidate division Zixibacteria bacterium]|nr:hypothetical protein [candidate division Zixibacteria bacterium]
MSRNFLIFSILMCLIDLKRRKLMKFGKIALYFGLLITACMLTSSCCILGGVCKTPKPDGNSTDTGSEILRALDVRILSRSMGYALGSPFDMKMRITNKSDEEIELEFPEGYVFDFYIYQKNELVYRYSEDERYPTGLKEIALAPGESRDFGGIWLCKDNDGVWVRGGRYEMIGIINTDPPVLSNILQFGLAD